MIQTAANVAFHILLLQKHICVTLKLCVCVCLCRVRCLTLTANVDKVACIAKQC